MSPMTPEFQQKLQAVVVKWDGFIAKVNERVQAAIAEADEGLDQLIAAHALDYGPMGAAFTALQTRFHGLGSKVSDAWDKISEELDGIEDEFDPKSKEDREGFRAVEDEQRAKYDTFRENVDESYAYIQSKKTSDWARSLYNQAVAEVQQSVTCTQCGSPFDQAVYHQAINVTCPSCGSVNAVSPGLATALYFGTGVHALADEQCWHEWKAQKAAEDAYNVWRQPTETDLQQYHAAARAYWIKYYQLTVQMNPGFTEPIEEAVAKKMKHFTAWDQPVEQQKRQFFQQLVEAVATEKKATVREVAEARPHHVDLDECAECVAEHCGRALFKLWSQVHWELDNKDGDKDEMKEWMKDQRDWHKERFTKP
ncbi:MAG: hypothetical protein ABI333_11320 [bacterium]